MTEEEAKTKWCPFARTTEKHTDGVTYPRNRVVTYSTPADMSVEPERAFANDLIGTHCIGSACMAWQWTPMRDGSWFVVKLKPTEGFCGLAGKL